MVKVPGFTDIGKATRELLYGGREGTFQYNKIVSVSSTTADGVEFTVNAVNRDDKVETALKAAYKGKGYAVIANVGSSGKVAGSISFAELAPGLSTTIAGNIPDQSSGVLGIDYAIPHLTVKTLVGLTSSPKVTVAATTGFKGAVLGGEAAYDTAKGNITKYTVGLGYNGPDYQAAAILSDFSDTLTLSYAHNIDKTTSAGAEVVRKLSESDTKFTLGYSKRLDPTTLTKIRLDNSGIASVLYEQEIKPKTKIAFSSQFDATDLNKAPKFGLAADFKN